MNAESFVKLIHADDRLSVLDLVSAAHGDPAERSYRVEFRVVHDEDVRWIRTTSMLERGDSGEVTRERGIVQNITTERQMLAGWAEHQRRRDAERLVSSVAHDFNNFLTAILGEASLAGMEDGVSRSVRESLEGIIGSAERAAVMTQALLGYVRRRVTDLRPIDLHAALHGMAGTLRHLIREDITLTIEIEDGLWPVRADPTQLQQVLMNLVINAVDASPRGRTVEIAVRRHASAQVDYPELSPGEYAHIIVEDRGTGIPPEALTRIFEPFYTTKPHGTGLGLPTCLAIARECGGTLSLTSEVGTGTVASLLIPILRNQTLRAHERAHTANQNDRSDERVILICEDNDYVRDTTVRGCRAFGYETLEVSRGNELRAVLDSGRQVDLVLTDVMMPGEQIHDVRQWALKVRPDLPFLFVSGYADSGSIEPEVGLLIGPRDGFLPKPFTPVSLAQRVREILEE